MTMAIWPWPQPQPQAVEPVLRLLRAALENFEGK